MANGGIFSWIEECPKIDLMELLADVREQTNALRLSDLVAEAQRQTHRGAEKTRQKAAYSLLEAPRRPLARMAMADRYRTFRRRVRGG